MTISKRDSFLNGIMDNLSDIVELFESVDTSIFILIGVVIAIPMLIRHLQRSKGGHKAKGARANFEKFGESLGWQSMNRKEFVQRFGSVRLTLLKYISRYNTPGLVKQDGDKELTMFTTETQYGKNSYTYKTWLLIKHPDWQFDGFMVSDYAPSLIYQFTKKRHFSKKPRRGFYHIETNSSDINEHYHVSTTNKDIESIKIENLFSNLPTGIQKFELKDSYLLVQLTTVENLDNLRESDCEHLEAQLKEILKFSNHLEAFNSSHTH